MQYPYLLLLAALALSSPQPVSAWTTKRDVMASWYGVPYHGKQTAFGEIFNQNDMTAAHPSLPHNTKVRVTRGDKSVVVRINDRGPFVENREIDLSRAAAQELGCLEKGVCKVSIEKLN